MRRLLGLSAAAFVAAAVLPATTATAAPPGNQGHQHQPLPAHGQRAVCAAPGHKEASCDAKVVTQQDSATPLATTSYSYGYRPTDLASAYQLPTSAGTPGTGPTVAIVDAYDDPTAASDLAAYRSQFGLGACGAGCFTKVNQTGGSVMPAGDTGWGGEISLDVDMVSATCPTCKILLVEANDNSFTNLMAAEDYATAHASYVSNSYGGNEFNGETTYDSHFNHPGIGITVSSGDNGYGVEYPAASQYVTAVGGTSLSNSAGAWSESAWSGAGSGCSAYEPKPSWQHDTGCARRTVADVSAVADPNTGVAVYDSYGSSGGANWFVYGGTSVAAPLVAGVWALTGSLASGTVSGGVPYANASGWKDVTSGSNTTLCTAGYLCQAGVGYDGPTGLGSPIGTSGFGTGSGSGGGGGGTTNNPPTAAFTSSCTNLACSFTDASTDSDGTVTGWSWTFGDGGTSTAQNPSHTYAAAGTYTVTLTATDNGGATGSVSHSVTVTAPATSIVLTAKGSTGLLNGKHSVALSWTSGVGSVNVYRNSSRIATTSNSAYTDSLGKSKGTFTYQVCQVSTPSNCSNTASVTF